MLEILTQPKCINILGVGVRVFNALVNEGYIKPYDSKGKNHGKRYLKIDVDDLKERLESILEDRRIKHGQNRSELWDNMPEEKKKAFSKKRSEIQKRVWEITPIEEKQRISDKKKESFKNMSEEDKNKLSETRSRNGKIMWENRDEATLKEISHKTSVNVKAGLSRMTKEEKAKWRASCGNWYNKMSEKEKKEYSVIRSEISKKIWKVMSKESKEKILIALHENIKYRFTSIEIKMSKVLDELGVEYKMHEDIGFFNVDFFIPGRGVVIETDGDYWHNLPQNIERDKRKDKYLKSLGYRVVRVWESDINKDPKLALLCKLGDIELA